jgi:hypothetical protein
MSRKKEERGEKMPFIVATYVYASSQGQRTHSAGTNKSCSVWIRDDMEPFGHNRQVWINTLCDLIQSKFYLSLITAGGLDSNSVP